MRWKNTLKEAAVTPEPVYLNRRYFLTSLATAGLAASGLLATGKAAATEELKPNSWEEITNYNNFYEFGTGKEDPARYADAMTIKPWTVSIEGLVDKPGNYAFEDIMQKMQLEERIYRFRCVEAWSMIIPFNGFELKDLLELAGVQSGARYVAFETLLRPEEMRGTRIPVIDWPYREGLRIDEAMHPLTIIAAGIYGRDIPKQNGAPLRLVVPWKYGFKSIKSIVRIKLTQERPRTSWNDSAPQEYGFYSNVNPAVSHPRWSQASERVIGSGLFGKRQPTKLFNGYDEVASLYAGMDLSRHY